MTVPQYAFERYGDARCDLVYIDGGHEEEDRRTALGWRLSIHVAALWQGILSAVHWQFGTVIFQFFGRFSAKLGPKTPLERRGSSCSAGRTKNQPRRPVPRPFRRLRNGPLQ